MQFYFFFRQIRGKFDNIIKDFQFAAGLYIIFHNFDAEKVVRFHWWIIQECTCIRIQ